MLRIFQAGLLVQAGCIAWMLPSARLLTPREEFAAGRTIAEGRATEAAAAREILVMHNLRLVSHITKDVIQNAKKTPSYIELFSEGVIGLNEAAVRYDGRGRFSKYAYNFIRTRVLQAITATSDGVLTHNEVMLYNRVKRVRFRLADAGGRSPTAGEVARCLNISETALRRIDKRAGQKMQVMSDCATPIVQGPSPPPGINLHSLVEMLDTPFEKRVFTLRIGQNKQVARIAELMCVSDETIRQTLLGSAAKLRREMQGLWGLNLPAPFIGQS